MIVRVFRWLAATVILSAAGQAGAADLAIRNVHVYPGPGKARLDDVTVVIRDGRISRVGARLDTTGMPLLDGGGGFLTAGLWNCHVHLTDPELLENPEAGLADMLLSRGFTTVLDTGSDPADARRIIAAVARGDYPGPAILTAGGSFVYTGGTPVYLPGMTLPELAQPAQAAPAVNAVLDGGANGIKIFAGSFMSPSETILLPRDIIAEVAAAAHARQSFVVAHPTSRDGLVNAMHGGVDILAHTAPAAGLLGAELVRQMREANVALIPTLKLWRYEMQRAGVPESAGHDFQQAGVAQLAEYAAAGGEILFGTDVGYMRDFDTTAELALMRRAGLDFAAVLASLTSAPATRFGAGDGTVEPGQPGDVAIFRADPASDVTALAHAAVTVRAGRVVYRANEPATPHPEARQLRLPHLEARQPR